MERHVMTVEDSCERSFQRARGEKLLIILQAYTASTHETAGSTRVSMMFGIELCLPCDLLFAAPPNKEGSATNTMADLTDQLHDIHHYAR
jgi:hypothetical protein